MTICVNRDDEKRDFGMLCLAARQSSDTSSCLSDGAGRRQQGTKRLLESDIVFVGDVRD
jgi:hypothetical protein